LQNVVHLFKDGDSLKVLQNCKKSLAGDGKLLIYDPVIPSEFGGESAYTGVAPMLDVALLVHAGGVDRTEEQWRSLLGLAGFPNVKFIWLQPQHWLIEARP
jgi:SAM-dependent methyltransferase